MNAIAISLATATTVFIFWLGMMIMSGILKIQDGKDGTVMKKTGRIVGAALIASGFITFVTTLTMIVNF